MQDIKNIQTQYIYITEHGMKYKRINKSISRKALNMLHDTLDDDHIQ